MGGHFSLAKFRCECPLNIQIGHQSAGVSVNRLGERCSHAHYPSTASSVRQDPVAFNEWGILIPCRGTCHTSSALRLLARL